MLRKVTQTSMNISPLWFTKDSRENSRLEEEGLLMPNHASLATYTKPPEA